MSLMSDIDVDEAIAPDAVVVICIEWSIVGARSDRAVVLLVVQLKSWCRIDAF